MRCLLTVDVFPHACWSAGSAQRGIIDGCVVIEYGTVTPPPPQLIVFRYDNGDFYEGGLQKGLRSGSGLFVSREGLQYKGEFSKNL
jgi:hypothetical protein